MLAYISIVIAICSITASLVFGLTWAYLHDEISHSSLLQDKFHTAVRRLVGTLAGFTPLLSGPDRVRWGTSFHNWIKTWYAPLLFRPQLFLRGVRLLFGDHAMFFRRAGRRRR
jgi:hypothetical protein